MEEVAASGPQEPLVVPVVQQRPVDIPPAVPPSDTAPEPVTREAVREPVKPPIEPEIVAGHPPTMGVAEEVTRLVQEPALDTSRAIAPKTPALGRAIPWAAAGVAVVAFLCIGALVALHLSGPISGISLTTLQLTSLRPGSLLLLSGTSFVGAGLLLGLLLWARRRQSM